MTGELAGGGEDGGRCYASLWSLRSLSIAFICGLIMKLVLGVGYKIPPGSSLSSLSPFYSTATFP